MSAISEFWKLHESGCFVLPNPWDIGTASFLQQLGFKALATTSAGFAFSRGLPDDVSVVPRDMMLFHIREMAASTSLPVNADFQAGYAVEPEGVAENVALCVATGVAGLSIEDASGDPEMPLFGRSLAINRIRAARRAIDDSGIPVVLTARCEAWLVNQPNAASFAIDRLVAFADAGADCLYAPGVCDLSVIGDIVRAVSPKPVNVIVTAPGDLTVPRLQDLGVRRVSVGSALSRVAWGALMRSAKSILETGTFDSLSDAVSFPEINAVFRKG